MTQDAPTHRKSDKSAKTLQLSTAGLILRPPVVSRSLRLNMAAGMLGMAWFGLSQGMAVVMLMEALGQGGKALGALGSVAQVAMLMQIPAALFLEKLQSRRAFFITTALSHRMLWFLPAFLPLMLKDYPSLIAWSIVVVAGMSALLAQASAAGWFSWMSDLVPEQVSGRFWGTRQSAVMVAFLLATVLSGVMLDAFSKDGAPQMEGFSLVFAIAAFLGCADIILHLWIHEPVPLRTPQDKPVLARILEPLKNRDFIRLTAGMGIFFFGIGICGAFGQVYLKRDFGASYTQISATVIAGSIGAILAGFLLGFLVDRVGSRAVSIILLVAGPCCCFVWFLASPAIITLSIPWYGTLSMPQPVLILFLVNLVSGGLYSGISICQLEMLGRIFPRKGRTMAVAVHWSCVGMFAAIGPNIGGWILDNITAEDLNIMLPFGKPMTFIHVQVGLHMMISWGLCIPIMFGITLQEKDKPLRTVLRQLNPINPLRIVNSIFNSYLVTMSSSPKDTADVVRKLGKVKGELAVDDLILHLDDPDPDVREECVIALSRIGVPETTQALLDKLTDADSDLTGTIIRNLRPNVPPEAAERLVSCLGSEDRNVRIESLRALGFSMRPDISNQLLDYFNETDDEQESVAAGDALARLEHRTALEPILSKIGITTSPVRQLSLAIAAADLMGEPGMFYRVLSELRKQPDTIPAPLKKLLKATIKQVDSGKKSDQAAETSAEIRRLEEAWASGDYDECRQLVNDFTFQALTIFYMRTREAHPEISWKQVVATDYRLNLLTTGRVSNPWFPRVTEDLQKLEILLRLHLICCVVRST